MRVWFHPAAEVEHLDHVAYYESRQTGLGAGYLAEIEGVMAAMGEGPQRYPLVGTASVRRVHLRQFPITVLFRELSGGLQILAVSHKRRRPNYWVTRL